MTPLTVEVIQSEILSPSPRRFSAAMNSGEEECTVSYPLGYGCAQFHGNIAFTGELQNSPHRTGTATHSLPRFKYTGAASPRDVYNSNGSSLCRPRPANKCRSPTLLMCLSPYLDKPTSQRARTHILLREWQASEATFFDRSRLATLSDGVSRTRDSLF